MKKPKTKVEVVRVEGSANRWGVEVGGKVVARGQCRTMRRRARGIERGIMDHDGVSTCYRKLPEGWEDA